MNKFIEELPKAELHLHLEGSLEPELMFQIADRNGIKIPFSNISELKKAYEFRNLQEFLDIYYQGASVLKHSKDFYEMTMAYLQKVASQNVVHVEVFFDPQTHTHRGIPFAVFFEAMYQALEDGKKELGISFEMIMCFLRHLDEEDAFKTLEMAIPYRDKIIGIGLDSSELGHPPSKFRNVYTKAIDMGFLPLAHAGEEGPSDYIWEALDLLKVVRIDHGNRCLDDDKLVDLLVNKQIALTVCPLSNVELKVIEDLHNHPLKTMLNKGLLVTVNSDDPAYFGGYINENFLAISEALQLSKSDIIQLAKNSFTSSFLTEKKNHIGYTKLITTLRKTHDTINSTVINLK